MTSPSTRSSRTDLAEQLALDRLVTALALLVPILTYVEVEATPAWYPTWLYLGGVTLPVGILPPFVFAVVVLWRALDSARDSGQGIGDTIEGVLAAILALLSVYAVWNLNVASPGVFWAGLPPMVLGVVLAVVVLARDIHGRVSG